MIYQGKTDKTNKLDQFSTAFHTQSSGMFALTEISTVTNCYIHVLILTDLVYS